MIIENQLFDLKKGQIITWESSGGKESYIVLENDGIEKVQLTYMKTGEVFFWTYADFLKQSQHWTIKGEKAAAALRTKNTAEDIFL